MILIMENDGMQEKRLVLIVEDNEDFQNLYGMIAEQAGYEVEQIYSGREALERLERGPIPSLVLLDSILPGAEGDKILAAARAKDQWKSVPIYILTADTRVTKKYRELTQDLPRPEGVIEKGAEAIRQLRELFNRTREV
jgi:CheY-like chemotaxis protein